MTSRDVEKILSRIRKAYNPENQSLAKYKEMLRLRAAALEVWQKDAVPEEEVLVLEFKADLIDEIASTRKTPTNAIEYLRNALGSAAADMDDDDGLKDDKGWMSGQQTLKLRAELSKNS